ncbi:MAG: arsenate reductase ArsC [Candidatus Thermoplasmatota archaeon]
MDKKKVLFLCTHNAARSQMAEGLLRSLYGNLYEVYSAGVTPSQVHPSAIAVMKEIHVDISSHRSKSIDEFKTICFDYVITVCDHAKATCPFFPGKKIIHHSFKDPTTLSEFRKIRDEIKTWIQTTFKDPNTLDHIPSYLSSSSIKL